MKIESTNNRNGNSKLPTDKKQKKERKKERKENSASIETESIEISDELKLLNKLLHATSNQFIPYPFYFINAAEKNIKQARTIAKNIQNQAESMSVFFNYLMIYDMVIDLSTKNHMNNIQWTPQSTNELLNNSEKWLFENLHNICLKNRAPISAIDSVVTKYIDEKHNNASNLPLSNKKESAIFIIEHLQNNPTVQGASLKKELSAAIKHYVNKEDQPTFI